MARRPAPQREQAAQEPQESRRWVSALITAGLGDKATGLSAEQVRAAAAAIIALADGFLVQWRLDPGRAPDGAELITGLAEVIALAAGRPATETATRQ